MMSDYHFGGTSNFYLQTAEEGKFFVGDNCGAFILHWEKLWNEREVEACTVGFCVLLKCNGMFDLIYCA